MYIPPTRCVPCLLPQDEKIPEPLGAAHTDPMAAFPAIKEAILRNYARCVCVCVFLRGGCADDERARHWGRPCMCVFVFVCVCLGGGLC
jgi:hypothetical protein